MNYSYYFKGPKKSYSGINPWAYFRRKYFVRLVSPWAYFRVKTVLISSPYITTNYTTFCTDNDFKT
jgi:hypothetical protein